MLPSLPAALSRSLVLGMAALAVLLSSCSCSNSAHEAASAGVIDSHASGANQAGAGMVVYRDPQSGEIIDSPAGEGDARVDSVEPPPGAERPQPQALPGGGVMIKADENMQPY